jgi:hypothetical protein
MQHAVTYAVRRAGAEGKTGGLQRRGNITNSKYDAVLSGKICNIFSEKHAASVVQIGECHICPEN